jgi:hypothetical protein
MFRVIKRWLKYKLIRASIKIKWNKIEEVKLNKVQERVMRITTSLIRNNRSELLINPEVNIKFGEKYYIKKVNSDGDVEKFITISKTSDGYNVALIGQELVNGINYHYHFDVWFNEVSGGLILQKFTRVLKNRRNKMEERICLDDEKTLDLILEKVK